MKRTIVFFACTLLCAAGAQAQSAADLLKSKGCLGCHDFDKKKVGPAFKDVAAKHKDEKDASATLVAKLKDGKGHMKINATEDELKTLVGAVLSTK